VTVRAAFRHARGSIRTAARDGLVGDAERVCSLGLILRRAGAAE
jgi:hypothetical protein